MTPPQTRSAARDESRRRTKQTRKYVAFATCGVVVIAAAIAVVITRPWATQPGHPAQPVRYLGVYEPDAPQSYAGVNEFAQDIGRQPNLVSYYSTWREPFQVTFATSAQAHGALTLVQMDPKNVSLASIVAGRYDKYLRSYAAAVKTFSGQVVLSFGHEMNGDWYSWGFRNTSPKVYVAAWRHIVTVFRETGASNVIWLWTVNVIDTTPLIPNPSPWWPGPSYVNWVGIDGYYFLSSQSFSQVFGPTIVAVRTLTRDPIVIAETGAAPGTGQPAEINDLFSGVSTYGLFGFVWFDENSQGRIWRLDSSGSFNAFRQDAKEFMKRSL
jgi:Glycosyl hydrolase family 26